MLDEIHNQFIQRNMQKRVPVLVFVVHLTFGVIARDLVTTTIIYFIHRFSP
jgi:hypothetical protein